MHLTTPPLLAASAPAPSPVAASSQRLTPDATPPGKPAPPESKELAKLMATPVADAVTAVTERLTKVPTLTVGGGTKEGTAAAVAAASMLQETSVLTQIIHRNAIDSKLSPELEMNLMSIATGLAAASSKVAIAQASPKPIKLDALLAEPAKQAIEVLATVADHVGRVTHDKARPTPSGYL
jgi:hypothetical protein